ncbi:transketolase, chloroplastic [Selaginella moellendorffii]|nr:transketolase, chloroplastic [Selaginella moellendorffii]|eukprot:XP_002985082.2 transketolase, chloroplastic [Selaginella moellendorffii]
MLERAAMASLTASSTGSLSISSSIYNARAGRFLLARSPAGAHRHRFLHLQVRASSQQRDQVKESIRKSTALDLEPGQTHDRSVDTAREEFREESELGSVEVWEDELRMMLGSRVWDEYKANGRARDKEWLQEQIDRRCVQNMRMLVVDAVNNAKAGHPGMPLGMAEVGFTLYRKVMKYNPGNPGWFNRDRFVLSAGHGCLLQYICLHLAGFESVQMEDLKRLCKFGARTPGHPENSETAGIEVTTGPLGQGVANAVGLALAERHLAARFNKPGHDIVNHRTFCIMGDGCAMEGISNESASLAGHWKLDKLTVIYDDNHNTIDGDTELAFSEDVAGRYRALGWQTILVEDIHEHPGKFVKALDEAFAETEKPTLIQVKSSIGFPSKKQGTSKAHHGTFDEEDVKGIKAALSWEGREPFYVVPTVYEEFKKKAKEAECIEEEWNIELAKYEQEFPNEANEFKQLLGNIISEGWEKVLPTWSQSDPVDATRSYSEKCLNALSTVIPGLIGGSADLASSNKAYLKDYDDFQHKTPWGRNVRYGIREHAMAAISNGLSLHSSGLIPFAATFLAFSDYMKHAMRLSALSRAGVIYICTHDSIGLGEDGPTHQPVEQLVGLRAIPNLVVLRPADGNETSGAYQVAVRRRDSGPTVIALSRQKVQAHVAGTSADKVEKGGYVVSDNSSSGSDPELIIIGTGSELCLCEGAAEKLRSDGFKVRVVSLVSWELFDEQPVEYKDEILPRSVKKRLSVEAGSPVGWREYVGFHGRVLAVNSFGKSGAYLDVFKKFGFTVDNVESEARKLLQV